MRENHRPLARNAGKLRRLGVAAVGEELTAGNSTRKEKTQKGCNDERCDEEEGEGAYTATIYPGPKKNFIFNASSVLTRTEEITRSRYHL